MKGCGSLLKGGEIKVHGDKMVSAPSEAVVSQLDNPAWSKVISGNSRGIERFHQVTKRLVFKWLNRRSQKTSFNWKGFEEYLEHYQLPEPRIVHHLYTLSFDS